MPHRFIRQIAVRNFILILVAVFSFQSSFSQSTDQNYPVSASAFVAAQPNQNLSAYFSSSQALSVTLLLKDLTKPSLQVYLKWSIEGPGVRVASMEGYIPPGLLLLDMGVLRRFSGLELQSDYFRNSVIEEQGLGGSALRTNLPEGFYTFRVQAMEAGTGRQVSNIAETYFSITTPLPPVINLPFNGAVLRQAQDDGSVTLSLSKSPQIQWMPRHYKQAGNTTTYDLKVCKVPDGYEPQEALDACVNPIIDDKANPGTFYPSNTGIGNSIIGALERGAKYAVRVTVHEFDANGDEVVFANEGRSEVVWFRYGSQCISPENFTIKEVGSGRVQLSWADQTDTKEFKIHYRKTGAASWTTQNVTGISTTVSGLSQGTYEFAVQSSCSDVFPANIQAFELSDDEEDDLIPALTDPLNTIVTVSGTGIPYVIDSLHSVLDVIKIPCASQISTYESCEADLPVVSLIGSKPLPSLSAGDVLSVYDMTVIVTSAGNGAGGFRGTGLARLPFMESTMVSVEFDGVQAWAPQEAGVPGGCVYQVNGYFRTKALSAEELARQQAGLVATLNNPKDSTAFTGTLSDALKKYDDGVTTTDLSRYTAAVLQGSQTIADALDDVVDEYSDPRLIHISAQLDSLMQVLKMNDSLMKATGDVIRIDNLTGIYTDLFQKLEELKNEGKPDVNNPVYAISNVQVSNVDDKSARISWQAEGPVSRYVIEYRDTDGGTLQETVTGTQLNLLRLRAGMEYNYRILAYNGDELVASYGEDRFKTTGKFVPVPVNLAYTRIDDNSVKITWDLDEVHKRYKIRYEDKNGEIRYVYPTTNTAVLDGLDPERFHDYEIVAYNQESLESGPANARVTTKEECKLGVRVENRLSIPSLEGNIHLLTATGCFTSDFKQVDGYPKVSWTNGTPGTVGANGVITFSDGEKAEISTGDIPFIGADRVLVVNPTTSKTYTAICQMSQTAQLCTYSVNVKISSAECKEGDFRIEASVDGQTYQTGDITASADGYVNLRAISCPGQIIWNNALGDQENIRMLVNDAIRVSAQCIQATKTCFSNSILVKSEREQECPRILLEHTSVDDGFLNLSTNRKAWLFTTGNCKGEIDWRVNDNARLKNSTTKDNKNEINHIKGKVVVYAKCRASSCPEAQLDVESPFKKCNGAKLVTSVSKSNPSEAILSVENSANLKFKIDNEYKNSHVIPVVPYSIYNITFENGCTFSKEVVFPLTIHFARGRYDGTGKPIEAEISITEDFYDLAELPKNWNLNLLADNCGGKVLWTNNNDENFKRDSKNLRVGSNVTIPTTTTTYYATCFNQDGVAMPYSRQITLVNNSNQCVKISGPESISRGENLKLSAEGCLGNVKWSRNNEPPFSTATTIYDLPVPKDNETSTVYLSDFKTSYQIDCDYPVCSATKEVSVYETPCSINVDQDKSSTKPGDEITLKASGCGTTIWSLAGNSLAVGSQLKIYPTETIKIIASCRGTQCWKEVEIQVPLILPPKITCETLEPYASPNQIYKGELNTIRLTADGCGGGTTIWNGPGLEKDSKGQGQSQLVIAQGVTDKAKYSVKCAKDIVGDTEAEIEVKSILRLDLTANPASVKKGQVATLTAIGCPGGTISWTGFNKSCQSPCNLENQVINEPTEFEATCIAGTEKVTKRVKVLIKTDPSGPSGKDYDEIHSSACSAFSAYVYPEDINVVEYPYPPKTKLKLTTSGCPTNGSVTWETWDRVAISGNTHSPNETTTYVAKCTVNGSRCAEAYRTIDIAMQFDCYDFNVDYKILGPGKFEFIPVGCPSSNSELKWTWYKKDGSSSSENTYTKGDLAAFEYRCTPDKNNPNQICYFTYKYSEDNETITVYGRKPYSFSGRIGADKNPADGSQVSESAARVIPCQQEYPMKELMASYFKTYACAFLENYTGADGKLSAAEAQEFLNKLKQAISAEPELQKYNLDFSKVSTTSIAEAFETGNCEAVGIVLGQVAQGTASVDTYNNDIRPTFANVAKALGGKIMNCENPLAATSKIIYGATPMGSNTVLAQWDKQSARYTYRLKEGLGITQGINIFSIQAVPEGVSDKWIGEYVAYFDAEAPNDFIGFYKDIQGGTCTTKYRRLLFGNCSGLCEEGFLPKEYYEMAGLLSLTATATDATCAVNDGNISLKATGGIAPYQFSLDGITFKQSSVFTGLIAGSYTATVKDSKGALATFTIAVGSNCVVCNAAPAPIVATDVKETINGRIAAYDYTGLFIAPDGRAVRLPAGAKPVVIRFTNEYVAPPQGTLQGFQLANGEVYFAEIQSYSNSFDGYRLIKTKMCPAVHLTDIYVGPSDKAYYMEKFSENGKCGYRLIEGAYQFTPTGSTSLVDIRVPVTGQEIVNWEYETCTEGPEYLTAAGRNKLTLKLKDFGHNNTGVTISDCVKGDKHTVSVEGVDKDITSKLIQINMCWDGKKWVITHSFKPGALKIPAGYNGTVAEVEAVSNEHANRVKETGVKPYDDGENYYQGIDFIQALVEVKEATLTLCNEFKVPKKYWETKDPGYAKSPFHGPTLSGIGDGAIAELKDIPELVGFGLEIATEPGKAGELWQGIKSITPDKVKKMALGAAQEKLDKYAQGGNTMKHEAGKDAVSIAMFVSGAVKSFAANGKKIAELGEVVGKLDDVADDVLEQVTKNVDEVAGKSINKALKDGDLDALDVEEIAEDVKDATSKADKSWLENFIKGKQYEKRIDSKIDAGDVAYFDDAASKFGISASELKGMDKVDQLQINIGNGNYFIADNAWSRKVTINGKTEIHVYINETKLSGTTPPTRRQSEFYAELAKSNTNFTSRSIKEQIAQVIPKDAQITVKSVIRTSGNGSVSDVYNIQKTF